MRILLDTNVVVSALVWGGVPYKFIEAATAGDFDLCASPALLAELRDVLGREHLASRLASQRSSVEEALTLYSDLVIRVSPLATPRIVPADADDDHVVAAAVAAGADFIVSGDRHLLTLGAYEGIAILPPVEMLRRIGG